MEEAAINLIIDEAFELADRGEIELKSGNDIENSWDKGYDVNREGVESSEKVSYKRPSGFRKGIRELVWENAKNENGEVLDPLTGRVMSFDEPWDMGHLPGHEFWKHQRSAEQRGISRKQFLDEYNDVTQYRPELPSSNRSHKAEDHTDRYLGP